ncbi:MAG TPA: TIGR00730 family Rossman fold protein [Enhygromyxa sp.]|nr:TIGR00730 family Rossman fold protein [Enhygromyxa sp.]
MRRVCVFCGSATGARPQYALAAERFAEALASRGLGLVYGGGHVGLMGVLADAALAAGCEVIGVIPQALHEREIGHPGLTELHVVDSMHERKAKMAALSDAFVVLPGGLGTLEEMFEVWTWGQLGFHQKPVGLLDVEQFWQPLITMLDRMVDEGFIVAEYRRMLGVDDDPIRLLERMSEWQPPEVAKWIRAGQT